ncbi:MAG: FAD-dependent oxidoreductase, partial [Simkaniaceae bacterium]|nr:FAD-dependent oxidoreductase [Simkaniaceae bacterium]
DLGLETTGIETDEKGFIKVDDHLKTACDGVWAFGDCIGRHLFRHSANFEGEYLFRTLFAEPSNEAVRYETVPHAVFTMPQIGGIGKTEQQLQAEGVDYVVGKCNYIKSGMGMALLSDHGFVKLLFDRKDRKLIGAHIIGEEASNMIHMPIAYMNMGATIDDLLKTIYIHPALPELVRNAARSAAREFQRPTQATR